MRKRREKGTTMVEVTVVVAILGFLASVAIPTYKQLTQNSRQKQAKAHLAMYYRGAKLMISELGYNPGNFPSIGFQPEETLHYRFMAADGEDTPINYPDEDSCVTTEM